MKRWLFYRRAGVLLLGFAIVAGALQAISESSAHAVAIQSARGFEARSGFVAAAPSRPAAFDHLAIPVVGVEPSDLHDSFLAARTGHVHHAIDIAAPRSTPVVAVEDGTITRLFTSFAGGITVYQLDAGGKLVYYYAHLDRYAPGLREGKLVRRGEVIGFVGSSGNAPESFPHLHFSVSRSVDGARWSRGGELNPYDVLTARGITYRLR